MEHTVRLEGSNGDVCLDALVGILWRRVLRSFGRFVTVVLFILSARRTRAFTPWGSRSKRRAFARQAHRFRIHHAAGTQGGEA